jgi:Bacterial regulatory protein, Fis family
MIKPLWKTEKLAILDAVIEADFNPQQAAKGLKIGKTSLYRKLKLWGIRTPFDTRREGQGIAYSVFNQRCQDIRAAAEKLREELKTTKTEYT